MTPDIAFLFRSIAVGIVLAAGLIPLAVIGSVIIGVILLVFVNKKSHLNPYIVVLSCADSAAEQAATELLAFFGKNDRLFPVFYCKYQKMMVKIIK